MASSKEQLQEFLDELPDDVELYMDKDGVTLRADYTDKHNSYHQKCFEV